MSDEGLFRYFSEVIERVGDDRYPQSRIASTTKLHLRLVSYTAIPICILCIRLRIYLYHFPALSQVPLSPSLIHRLVKAYPGTVAGVKDSSGQWDYSHTLIQVHHTLLRRVKWFIVISLIH